MQQEMISQIEAARPKIMVFVSIDVSWLNRPGSVQDIFGWLKYQLKLAGTPIPINDVWIAAHAIETGSMLITFDSHFDRIPGLRLWAFGHS